MPDRTPTPDHLRADPHAVANLVVQYLASHGKLGTVTGRQLGELAALAAAMLDTLGIDPQRTATTGPAMDEEWRMLMRGSYLASQLRRWTR